MGVSWICAHPKQIFLRFSLQILIYRCVFVVDVTKRCLAFSHFKNPCCFFLVSYISMLFPFWFLIYLPRRSHSDYILGVFTVCEYFYVKNLKLLVSEYSASYAFVRRNVALNKIHETTHHPSMGSKFPKFPGNYGTNYIECNIPRNKSIGRGVFRKKEEERTMGWRLITFPGATIVSFR